MRIVFLGSGAFGLPTLERLATRHDLRAIVTQPDRPAGRKRALTPTPVGQWAAKNAPAIPLRKPENINTPEETDVVRTLEADAWVVIAFGQKLSEPLLAERFAINLHASLLPRWRGAAPIHHAVLAGDAETGNSVITLAQRMDAGEVLGQSRRPIEPHRTTGELHDLLAQDGPDLVESVLAAHDAGTLKRHTQDESLVTLAGKLSRADGWIDPARPAAECRGRIHGLNPWPGVDAQVAGEPLRLLRAEALDAESAPSAPQQGADAPGAAVEATRGVFRCGGGTALRLLEVQPPGKKPMAWEAYAAGRDLPADATLRSGAKGTD